MREFFRRVRVLQSYNAFFRGSVKHFQERIYNRVDLPVDVTLEKVFERIDSNKVFLKIDIEGCEYRIIEDIGRFAGRISGMVIEFHDIGPLRLVFNAAIARLQNFFEIVHLHANNYGGLAADGVPEVLEVTFAKKPLQGPAKRRTELPLPGSDAPNDARRADYKMRFCF